VPKDASVLLEVDGFEVAISNPGKLFFEQAGITKLDLVSYYLAVADGALRGVRDRPMALKRFVNGAAGEAFFQKRAPASVPEFVRTVELSFPRVAPPTRWSSATGPRWRVVNLGRIDQPAPGACR
jgi:DNA primase